MNSIMQLSTTLGIGISSAIYDAIAGQSTDPASIESGYRGAWWLSVGLSTLGNYIVGLLYFLSNC